MDNDGFNMSMRKFLKQVGVTSQQQIEASVRAAIENGTLKGSTVAVRATVTIEEIGLNHIVEGQISVGSGT